jgi:hypothetical protein
VDGDIYCIDIAAGKNSLALRPYHNAGGLGNAGKRFLRRLRGKTDKRRGYRTYAMRLDASYQTRFRAPAEYALKPRACLNDLL